MRYCLAQGGDTWFVFACLQQNEPEIVVRLRKVGPQTNGLAELGGDLLAVGGCSAQQKAENVASVGAIRIRGEGLTKTGNGVDPIRRGARRRREVQCRFQLPHAVIDLVRAQEGDPEIDKGCGRRRQEGNRPLQTGTRPCEVALFAQRGPQKRVGFARSGIECEALPQLGQRSVFGPAVPERDAQMIVSHGRLGLQRSRALQVRNGGRQIALLPQCEAEQGVRIGVRVVQAKRRGEAFAGGAQVTL